MTVHAAIGAPNEEPLYTARFAPSRMNPHANSLWPGKRWQLALLLACLGMLGPFSIDTYLPAFAGIARSVGATPVQMQQTLSSYLLGFAVMNLFHGALSDSLGRRPVVLASLYPVVTAVLAAVVHHERLTRVQYAGIAAVVSGVALLSVRA